MSSAERSERTARLVMLMHYKAWANRLTFGVVLRLPAGEATRVRPTRFGGIAHTLNHVYVIDDVFHAHLTGRKHRYTSRNTDHPPSIEKLWQQVQRLDQWYVDVTESLSDRELSEVIDFDFIGGGTGRMTREEILLHVVNHGTYHRGFVSDMLYQIPVTPPANDLTVFLRDAYHSGTRQDRSAMT